MTNWPMEKVILISILLSMKFLIDQNYKVCFIALGILAKLFEDQLTNCMNKLSKEIDSCKKKLIVAKEVSCMTSTTRFEK